MRNLAIKLFGSVVAACIGSFILFSTPAYAADTTIAVDSTNFPDANFRSYVETHYDTDSSGYLDDTSLTETVIDVSGLGIADLTGIEHFPTLEFLSCYNNQLASLNVTQNLLLETLSCYNNQLTSLNVTNNPALGSLVCDNNQLASLNVTQNLLLGILICADNPLTSLNVTNNLALEYLNCENNQLTSLNVINNFALTHLICDTNQLASLDVTQNPALWYLNCFNNQLTSLDVTQNPVLEQLYFDDNRLTNLNVTQNPALQYLGCTGNQLTSLDVTQNPALELLDCSGNQLTSLDITNNPALDYFYCEANQLYDVIGVSASPSYTAWVATTQSLTIPVFPDPANPGTYISASGYPLSLGHSIVLASGADYSSATASFTAAALNTPYGFTTTTAAGTVEGTITFVLGPPPMPLPPIITIDLPAPPSALPNTGDAALLPLALAALCALLGCGAVAATRRNAARRQRTGSHSR